MATVYKYLTHSHVGDGADSLFVVPAGRTRTKGFKLQQGRSQLKVEKNLLMVQTVQQWNSLS